MVEGAVAHRVAQLGPLARPSAGAAGRGRVERIDVEAEELFELVLDLPAPQPPPRARVRAVSGSRGSWGRAWGGEVPAAAAGVGGAHRAVMRGSRHGRHDCAPLVTAVTGTDSYLVCTTTCERDAACPISTG